MFNVAILGLGRISEHHLRAYQALGCSVVAVCDLKFEKRDLPIWREIPFYADIDLLSSRMDIDLCSINTPSGLHYEHARKLLKVVKKGLVIEKPTVLRVEEFDDLVKLANSLGKSICPVFQNRFNKAVEYCFDRIELAHGALSASATVRWSRGESYYNLSEWRGTFSLDGGALTNQGIHHLDLLLQFMSEEPKRVFGIAKQIQVRSIEVEDYFVGILEFSNQRIAKIEVTTAVRPNDLGASLFIMTRDGYIDVGGIACNELLGCDPSPTSGLASFSEDFEESVYGHGHVKIIDQFIGHLKGEGDLPVALDSVRRLLLTLHCLYRSSVEERWVSLDEPYVSSRLGESNCVRDLYR